MNRKPSLLCEFWPARGYSTWSHKHCADKGFGPILAELSEFQPILAKGMLECFEKMEAGEFQLKDSVSKGPLRRSEAWEPPQFQEKRSRSEKAILGALGEFRGILGAALGIGNSILGIRNSILGMASHDLINTKPTILGATLGAIPGITSNPPERFSFAPAFSERFFKNWGGPCALEKGSSETLIFPGTRP